MMLTITGLCQLHPSAIISVLFLVLFDTVMMVAEGIENMSVHNV
jgi:hypothetical protein